MFKRQGYKVWVIDPLTNKPLKHNEVVMAGFRDKIAKKYNQDIYYLEDGNIAECHKLTCYGEDQVNSLINKYKVQEK